MILSIKSRKRVREPQRYSAFHLSRPMPLSEIVKVVEIKKKFTMSSSTYNRLSKKTKTFLDKSKVKISIVQKKGRPIALDPKELLKVIEYHRAGFSVRKIEQKTGLAKSTIHYLIKHSKRNRIKYDGSTVFVE